MANVHKLLDATMETVLNKMNANIIDQFDE